mgnify:FL=1
MAKKSSFGDLSPQARQDLARRIRALVEAIGTQSAAAETAGLTPRQLSRMLSAEAAPSLLPVAKLASAAGKSLDWVAYGATSAPDRERVDPVLVGHLVEGVLTAHRAEGVLVSEGEIGQIVADEYDVIVSTVTDPSERRAAARVGVERLRRALRARAESNVRRKRG